MSKIIFQKHFFKRFIYRWDIFTGIFKKYPSTGAISPYVYCSASIPRLQSIVVGFTKSAMESVYSTWMCPHRDDHIKTSDFILMKDRVTKCYIYIGHNLRLIIK